jgi:hypothetical protein
MEYEVLKNTIVVKCLTSANWFWNSSENEAN